MYTLLLLVLAFLLKTTHGYTTTPNNTTPFCGHIPYPSIPGKEILSITTQEFHNHSVGPDEFQPAYPGTSNIYVCEVNVTLTHPGVNDTVLVQVWLPLSEQENVYNSRFVALGGGGFAAGVHGEGLAKLAIQGFASASTDGGIPGSSVNADNWGILPNGKTNLELLKNLATRAPHDVVTIGKAVTESYYGSKPQFAYWDGCSTGGRQGMEAAQRYPEEFDGILAGAPAIYWNELQPGMFWPQAVMQELGVFPSNCEIIAVVDAGITACDEADGVKDGVISDLEACKFKAADVVGTSIQCDGSDVVISEDVAKVVQKIWDGPVTPEGKQLWYGYTIGTPLQYTTNTTTVDGKRVGAGIAVSTTWILNFLEKDLSFDLSTIKVKEYADLAAQSVREYGDIIESSDPDLSSLKDSGAKLLVWHGEADQLIPHKGTLDYRQKVDIGMGGTSEVDEFFRLFLAPGVDHCGSGATLGAPPKDAFAALRSWVENGTAPEVLPAEAYYFAPDQFTRKLCLYPGVAKYNGSGDPSSLESFDCVAT